ncbi:CLUMA_CG012961, isoform A [Clunio marinus]|uniref:CLUMA_CG012961, isoform A n=1 Tax=Clunio marinus TaxID=568069 RepID=A0A1J1IMK3_9DIPT|nr:CLUMA_CG012961, isoform A [Clunio marinus]
MNVVQNKKKTVGKPRYRQRLNFEVVEEQVNPERIVNEKIQSDITRDVFGNTTTFNSSSDSQVILVLTEGRGHASGEVGIAAIDINSPTLILCQLSDNVHYSDTLNKIQILNPMKILLPDTIFETMPIPKLIKLVKESFSHIAMVPVQRKYFNDKQGLEQITTYCSRKSTNILQVIARKYYCLSSAAALLSYIKNVNMLSFGKNCLKVEYQTKQGGMMIDAPTSTRLELLYSLSAERNAIKKFSLFAILNRCQTRIGQRHLRANILEPSCNIDFIKNRQEQIKVLMENKESLSALQECLENFRSVDQLMKISLIVPADDCEKAIEKNIQITLLLKHSLESIKHLSEVLLNTVSESFEEDRQLLSVGIYQEILDKINEKVQPDIHKNRLAQKHFQHLFAVRGFVNETIDFLRKLYTEATDKIRDYVSELTEQCQLPIKLIHSTKLGHHLYLKNPDNHPLPTEFQVIHHKGSNVYMTTSQLIVLNDTTQTISFDIIRVSNTILCDMLINIAQEIDAIHHLIGVVIDLDIVQSLTQASTQDGYCCPSFERVMRIEDGYHPMLERARNKDDVVMNNVISTPQYNFYIISGPNMSGKTIYIKMIAIIQIMAQIGCFVPASSAMLRMTDKLFSRIGFQDSIEQGASSFTVELREMDYIYSNLTPNSLVIMDELCRSTNPQEGELICWNYCEKLLKFIGVSNESYFKPKQDIEIEKPDEASTSKRNSTVEFRGCDVKLRDVARPFIFLTTHFKNLTKLPEQFNNAINLHMLVEQRIIEERLRLDFKYKIQSGPSSISNYGLALARCLRFPSSLLDRADELIDQIEDETLVSIQKQKNDLGTDHGDHPMDTTEINEETSEMDKEVIDLFSCILLLMSTDENNQPSWSNINIVNQKLHKLTNMMSKEFREIIGNCSLNEIISILNGSKLSDNSKNISDN